MGINISFVANNIMGFPCCKEECKKESPATSNRDKHDQAKGHYKNEDTNTTLEIPPHVGTENIMSH